MTHDETVELIRDVLESERRHLAADEIVTYATERETLSTHEKQRVETHTAECTNCRDELARVEQVHASVQADPQGRDSSRKQSLRPFTSSTWLAAAAAVLAAMLVYPAYLGIFRSPSDLEQLRDWSGPVEMELITGSTRSLDQTPTLTIDPQRPFVILGIQVVVTSEVTDETPVLFQILEAGKDTLLSLELSAQAVREQVRSAGVVTWLVPVETLEPGEYIIRVGLEDGTELLNVPVEVVNALIRD